MSPDERSLLLLLAKMVLHRTRPGAYEKYLREEIARVEQSESYKRDAFVAEIMKGYPKT